MKLFETLMAVAIAAILGFVTLTSGTKLIEKTHGTPSSETAAIYQMAGLYEEVYNVQN